MPIWKSVVIFYWPVPRAGGGRGGGEIILSTPQVGLKRAALSSAVHAWTFIANPAAKAHQLGFQMDGR